MSDTITDDQIAELEWLHAMATPGPREVDSRDYVDSVQGEKVTQIANYERNKDARCSVALYNHFPALLRRLREAERERDEAEQEVEDLKTNADEYDKDCTKALFAIANECNYEWDGDGATADDLREHITTTLEECTKTEQPLLEKIRVIERERAYLAGEVVRLRCENARQRKIGAAEELERQCHKIGHQYLTATPRLRVEDLLRRAEELRKEATDDHR